MTTYGPRQLSLEERLAGSDAVTVITSATLIRSEVDRLSESQREIGSFELTVADVLHGDVPETIRLVAVRDADSPWPFPEKYRFLALLQRDEASGGWVLVHNSAFRLRGSSFAFDQAIGCQGGVEPSEKVSITEVRRLLKARQERAAGYDASLREREGELLHAELPRLPSEMPETPELAAWLDIGHAEGGRPGEPIAAPSTDDARPPRRRPRRGDSAP